MVVGTIYCIVLQIVTVLTAVLACMCVCEIPDIVGILDFHI